MSPIDDELLLRRSVRQIPSATSQAGAIIEELRTRAETWRKEFERADADRQRLIAALWLPLLFHDGGPWDEAKRVRWLEITGRDDASSRSMNDHIRDVLAGLPETCRCGRAHVEPLPGAGCT